MFAWKRLIKFFYIFFLAFFCSSSFSEIIIDGKLSEEEWKSAREINKFYEVFPFSLKDASGDTRILIQEDEKGIYIGFINIQTKETIRANQHQRDQGARPPVGDQVGITIDFDNDGKTGYRFSVNAGNSINDGTVINENEQNLDWDGDWLSATSITDNSWYAEIFIPWTITSMKSQKGEERIVGLCFYRMLLSEYKVSATCKGSPYVNKFLSVFDEMNFKKYEVKKQFIGSYRYSSLWNHNGCIQSRRDDLESILYMLMYLYSSNLPWCGISGENKLKSRIYPLKEY